MRLQVSASGARALQHVLERFRWGIPLLGVYDSTNRIFALPEPAAYNPPSMDVRVYHGGRRLNTYEYQVKESVPGSGNFDRIHLTSWAPSPRTQLVADYMTTT